MQYNRGLRAINDQDVLDQLERSARTRVAESLVADRDSISNLQGVHVRRLIPDLDLNDGDDLDNGVTNGWHEEIADADAAVNSDVQLFQIDSDNAFDGKAAVLFGLNDISGDAGPSGEYDQVHFETPTGGTIEIWDVSQLDAAASGTPYEGVAMAFNPIFLSAGQSLNIVYHTAQAASTTSWAVDSQIYGVVADAAGQDLEDSDRFVHA